MTKSVNKLLISVIAMIGSLTIGIIGFKLVEGYSLVDAFYMTVITISTVGFGEVHELSANGKLFTIFYIILNLGIFAYVVSMFSTYIFEGEFRKIYKNIIIGREVKKMKNHVIVCGLGRNGRKACEELYASKMEFIVIEKNIERINLSPKYKNYQIINNDATIDDVLMEAGVQKASTIITTLPNDADNVFITLTARELNPNIVIIARASEENSERKLHRAGASRVVLPDTLGGLHMAQMVTKPYVIEFLDLLNGIGESSDHLVLEEFSFDQFKQEYRNKSLKELDIRNLTKSTIIAIKDNVKGFQFNPGAHSLVAPNNVIIVLGDKDSLQLFKSQYCL